jgi:hypothetical protein
MKQSMARKNRKELENKLAKVFEKDMKALPAEFRKIMVNDLVSAFESRLCVLSRAQSNLNLVVIDEREVEVETI